jgi:asparagine synthase (glutamine-hydrolysing)
MQATDCLTWLPGNILPYGDRMSMIEGLEMRLPFLDKSLVGFGLSIPDNLKIRNGEQKWLMRRWRLGDLPPSIMARRKWGFRAPLAQWFRGPMRSFLMDHLTDPRGICAQYGNPKVIETLVQGHVGGEIDASATLWKLLSTEVWRQRVLLAAAAAR